MQVKSELIENDIRCNVMFANGSVRTLFLYSSGRSPVRWPALLLLLRLRLPPIHAHDQVARGSDRGLQHLSHGV